MTLIASTITKSVPFLMSDLLLSSNKRPEKFLIPVSSDDIMRDFKNDSGRFPIGLTQKVYILKDNVCAAFAGSLHEIKIFLEDIIIFCNSHTVITPELIEGFLYQQQLETRPELEFIILVTQKTSEQTVHAVRFKKGDFYTTSSEIFGEVWAAGSGSGDFIREIQIDAKMKSRNDQTDITYAVQANLCLLSKLLARERASLHTVNKHWGAGFEVVMYSGGKFVKVDRVTYVIYEGRFDKNGDITVPIPAIILHHAYHGNILLITAIIPGKGKTEQSETHYTIRCNDFGVRKFIVAPFYSTDVDLSDFADTSFDSYRNAAGYIIESENGIYLPAGFNEGPQMKVEYVQSKEVIITMQREIHDRISRASKEAFGNFKQR